MHPLSHVNPGKKPATVYKTWLAPPPPKKKKKKSKKIMKSIAEVTIAQLYI